MVAQAVHAVATPLVTIAPSVTPTVHAVVSQAAAAPSTQGLTDLLNRIASYISPTDVVVLAGLVSSAVLALINKFPWLKHEIDQVQNARRFLVSVALPFAGTYLASVASGVNTTGAAPWIFLVSLVAFRAVKLIQATSTTASPVTARLAPVDGGAGEQPSNG